jgi:outer membrane protein assembly factor BamB
MRTLSAAFSLAAMLATAAAAQRPEELFIAARAGDVREVRRIVDAGAPVDAQDRYGSTALIMAAAEGRVEVVKLLLDLGADPNHREGFYGADALGMALFRDHSEVAMVLLTQGADDRAAALQFAIEQENQELARAAVESGPIHVSRLEEIRARSAELEPVYQKLLAAARSRPDPDPPTYAAADLEPYVGAFEGWDSGTRVEVTVEKDRMLLQIDGGHAVKMTAAAEHSFQSPGGDVRASFWGRAGTIEGIFLERPEAEPERLRRSVAEPLGARAYQTKEEEDWAVGEPTVHWPSFRGANASGIGDGADTLTDWNLETGKGVRWTAELPGLGNSSPVVWGNQVFVTTAVAEGMEQSIRTGLTGAGDGIVEEVPHSWRVLAFDKTTGRRLWDTEVGRAVPKTRRHFKATQANSTPVTDGRHLVAIFPTAGIACLDLDGNIEWRHDLGGLNAGAFSDPGIQWGFASSPILHGSKVIQQIDVHDGAHLVAWDLETGKQLWRTERDVAPSWSTPALLKSEQGEELVVNGSTIFGYDPATGKELWSLAPNSELVIAAPVVGQDVVYVSAGYPPVKPIYAVPAGTRGSLEVDPRGDDERLAWSHGIGGAYMPTPLLYRGIYYVVHHNGRLVAYDAGTGEAIFKSRFSRGGVFTGSPVAVNGKLYLPTEEGLLYILEAGPEYREIAVHEFGEPLMATSAVSDGVLFFRTPSRLIAIGKKQPD